MSIVFIPSNLLYLPDDLDHLFYDQKEYKQLDSYIRSLEAFIFEDSFQ